MIPLLSLTLVVLLTLNLFIVGTSRISALIRATAFQGLLLGIIPFLTHNPVYDPHTWILSLSSILIKGILIPFLLFRAMRGVITSREVEPYVGFTLSVAFGVVFIAFSFIMHDLLSNNPNFASKLVPTAISMALCGLFLTIARKKALTQVIGYLVFENGIYAFGVSIAAKNPLLVEMGVLLDALVAVFVMGIVIYHINREFDSISISELETLRE